MAAEASLGRILEATDAADVPRCSEVMGELPTVIREESRITDLD